MKKRTVLMALRSVIVLLALVTGSNAIGQTSNKDQKLVRESNEAKDDFITTDGLMSSLFANSYGYAIFPNVGKGGIGIVGAAAMELCMKGELLLVKLN
jgi:hypothetical protein